MGNGHPLEGAVLIEMYLRHMFRRGGAKAQVPRERSGRWYEVNVLSSFPVAVHCALEVHASGRIALEAMGPKCMEMRFTSTWSVGAPSYRRPHLGDNILGA